MTVIINAPNPSGSSLILSAYSKDPADYGSTYGAPYAEIDLSGGSYTYNSDLYNTGSHVRGGVKSTIARDHDHSPIWRAVFEIQAASVSCLTSEWVQFYGIIKECRYTDVADEALPCLHGMDKCDFSECADDPHYISDWYTPLKTPASTDLAGRWAKLQWRSNT